MTTATPSDMHVEVTDADLRMLLGTFPRTAAYPTSALTFAERYGVPLINDLTKARAAIADLEAQQDALLAACEAARDYILREMTGASIQTGQVLDQLQAAIRRARGA